MLRVFQIEGSVPPYLQRLVCDISAEAQEAARQVGPVAIAPNAVAQIRGKGGSLYLWQEPFGRAYLVDKADFEWPRGIHFREFKVAGVQIQIASAIDPPERLTITRSVLPPLHLHIEWDGKVWGARGDVIAPGQTPWSW